MLYCAQRSTKKTDVLFAKARHVMEPVVSKSPPHRLENSRAEAFAKRQSVTSITRKEFENPLANRRKEVNLNIKFT